MEAVRQIVEEVLPRAFVYSLPMMELICSGREILRDADVVFVGGTNALSNNMNAHGNWRLRLSDLIRFRNVVLLGVGWWQYQDTELSWTTRFRLKHVLSKRFVHWARDSYTSSKLNALDVRTVNCGCPTLRKLTPEHCAGISPVKGRAAVITLTDYFSDRMDTQRIIWDVVRRNYQHIYFWPQAYHDLYLAAKICQQGVEYLPPSLRAFDAFLQERRDVDVVGTRLHAGIRALQFGRRAIIVGMDNRSIEMGKDFNLPVVCTDHLASQLEERIRSSWPTRINLPREAIARWAAQFQAHELSANERGQCK